MHLSREATIKCCCQEIEIHTHTHTYVHSMDRPSGTWTDEAPSLALAFGMPLAWPCTFACMYVDMYLYSCLYLYMAVKSAGVYMLRMYLLLCFVYFLLVACLVMQESRCVCSVGHCIGHMYSEYGTGCCYNNRIRNQLTLSATGHDESVNIYTK